MDTSGNITAEQITTKKVNIDTTDSASASLGHAVIVAGQQQITIDSTAVTANSKVFTSLTTDLNKANALIILNKTAGASFTVKIVNPVNGTDVGFDWWIVN
jgi:hypothetical protein